MVPGSPIDFLPHDKTAAAHHRLGRQFVLAIAVLAILLVVFTRIRLLDVPLERDEGEYAYAGQLILEGVPPYQHAFNMKLPGTYAAYASIMAIFGQTPAGIRWGFLIVNLGAVALVFLIGRRLFGSTAALASSAGYALLSVSPSVMGSAAHATHFVVLPALLGVWLLLRWDDSRRLMLLFCAALCFGAAFMMKQHGVFFGVFGAAYVLWRNSKFPRTWTIATRDLALFLAGAALPFLVTSFLLWRAGLLERYLFWTFTYAREYASVISPLIGIGIFFVTLPQAIGPNVGIWLLAGVGVVRRSPSIFFNGLTVFSFLAIFPGFYFRPHYYVLVLPAVALLAGAGFAAISRIGWRMPVSVLAAAMFIPVIWHRDFFFRMTPIELCRELFSTNPFPEAVHLGEYIRNHSTKDARVAVLGSEPEVYFYAQRRSATGYIYAYPMMEPQPFAEKMQLDFIHELEANPPEFVVQVEVPSSWLKHSTSRTNLTDWWAESGRNSYEIVGVADILSKQETVYRWDVQAAGYRPRSSEHVLLFRRRDTAGGTNLTTTH